MNLWLLIIPVVSAMLGWFGAMVAGRILIYRIFAHRKQTIARSVSEPIASSFSFAEIEARISDPANIGKIMPIVERHIEDFLRHKLKQKMPVVGMLIGNKTIDSLKEVFLKEIEELFPHVMKQFAGNLQSDLNLAALIETKITNVSPKQLDLHLTPVLRYFKVSATLMGFLIGVVNLLIVMLFH